MMSILGRITKLIFPIVFFRFSCFLYRVTAFRFNGLREEKNQIFRGTAIFSSSKVCIL